MPRFGIDTSILVRLLTGDPESDYQQTKTAMTARLANDPATQFAASNLVIAEAYFVLQHHYGVSKEDARSALSSVLSSGLVRPQNGDGVIDALRATSESGLLDRLIVNDYAAQGLTTISNDRRMSRLRGATLLLPD